ncbi:methionine--tRNA ligase [Streptomyces antimycoticus]|uniref:Methionine--tRNA ligase n=1 Tax=Streptomyces antimycoticus TaxID=68175 RepID=A0A499UP33_9ACTN|nr:methionine--tRNA ligase [Streptomyces antimycoticus]
MARHLITSALPYINGIKHLGNMVGSMLPADVYSRYMRQRGHEVLYICATDEHGTPAELAAKEAGLPVDEFCAQQHEAQKAIYDGFGLAFDYFGRSSSAQNVQITQTIARELKTNGFIEERSIRQVYSNADGRFLPDRYIEGTCPHCGYDKARGDQCENCTRVLDPTDLIDARSAISGSSDLEVRETKHLFLLQSKLAEEVAAWVDERGKDWPTLASSIARKWLNEGLQDRAITRDLDWGVPVPADTWPDLAAEGKVFYVWFDAPIEYIGATKEWADAARDTDSEHRDWKSWWYDVDETVRYTEFMAKDNVPFHTVMFPATLLGTRDAWKKVDYVKAFNWLTYYGGKFSTSQKRGVFTDAALEVLPADYWRYFLMANAPESDDTSFTWEHFTATVNKDLADTLGNFVNRVLSFSRKRFGDEVPAGRAAGEAEERLGEEIARLLAEYEEHMDALQFRKAAAALRALWSAGNSYLEEKAPWLEIKTDQEAAALTLRTAMNLIHLYAIVSEPFIPASARAMRSAFALSEDTAVWVGQEEAKALASVPAGTAFTVPRCSSRRSPRRTWSPSGSASAARSRTATATATAPRSGRRAAPRSRSCAC